MGRSAGWEECPDPGLLVLSRRHAEPGLTSFLFRNLNHRLRRLAIDTRSPGRWTRLRRNYSNEPVPGEKTSRGRWPRGPRQHRGLCLPPSAPESRSQKPVTSSPCLGCQRNLVQNHRHQKNAVLTTLKRKFPTWKMHNRLSQLLPNLVLQVLCPLRHGHRHRLWPVIPCPPPRHRCWACRAR